jgi:hypothetical protein
VRRGAGRCCDSGSGGSDREAPGLEFTEAHAYGASYNDNLKATHGGTLIVK